MVRLPLQSVDRDNFGAREACKILAQPVKPRRGAIDRSNICTGERELCSFAAGCCAQVGNVNPCKSPKRRAGSAAAASCTHQAPSENPGSSEIAPCASVRTVPVGSTRPRSRSAQDSASRLTVRSSAGSWPLACCNRARSGGAIGLAPALEQPFRRVTRNVIGRPAAPFCATRRSTALTRPA